MTQSNSDGINHEMFGRPEWYDRGVNWSARLNRELPVLQRVFGPPGGGGILDAAAGPGHQAAGLARLGYAVTALDIEPEMLELANKHAAESGVAIRCVESAMSDAASHAGSGFDGLLCVGNGLAAAGDRETCRRSFQSLAASLRPGGRMFIQILNYQRMRDEHPCVRGPRLAERDGVEYVSARHFTFEDGVCVVTNVTFWNEGGWRMHTNEAVLYPVETEELSAWCGSSAMRIDALWGDYQETKFDRCASIDLILVATRI